MTETIIAWDLGATKCTAGVVRHHGSGHDFSCERTYTVKLADTVSLEDLIAKIEANLNVSMTAADAICIGAAGHYDGRHLLLEGIYPYAMNFGDVADQLAWKRFAVIHDYAPIVCATFTSYMHQPENVKRLNHCDMQSYGRRVAFGIGTGLGVKDGVLFPNGDFWLGRNEMGHIGVSSPPASEPIYRERHNEFLKFLYAETFLKDNQAITFEKILSGLGVVRLYQFLYENTSISPEEVGMKMQDGLTNELVDMFAWYAGLFVGTIQMTFMPEGGIWMTGGVALLHQHVFERHDFFHGIYASPAYRVQRDEYPLGILCNHEHALIGGGYYATRRLLST